MQCHLRLTFRRIDYDLGHFWSLSVLSVCRICAEVQRLMCYLMLLCELNHCEFYGHCNLRDPGERDELPLLYLSERKRIHLHVFMSLPAHGPDMLPDGKSAGR